MMSWLRSSQMRRTYLARSPSTRCHVAQWCYATRRSSMPEGTKERKKEKKTRLVFHQITLGLPRLALRTSITFERKGRKALEILPSNRHTYVQVAAGRPDRSALSHHRGLQPVRRRPAQEVRRPRRHIQPGRPGLTAPRCPRSPRRARCTRGNDAFF